MEFLLQQLLVLFALLTVAPVVIGIVLALLAKLRLLPLAFCVLILSCIPTWASAHRVLSIGLLAACVLYPILHWTLQIVRWRPGGTVLRESPACYSPTSFYRRGNSLDDRPER